MLAMNDMQIIGLQQQSQFKIYGWLNVTEKEVHNNYLANVEENTFMYMDTCPTQDHISRVLFLGENMTC